MRKLTLAQLDAVSKQRGLFDAAVWRECLAYLHAWLTYDDPSNMDGWTLAMQRVKAFVDWTLQQARESGTSAGFECLQLASSKQMSDETLHELNEDPCVFSGRCTPLRYTTSQEQEPCAVVARVQTRFHWWAHHEHTGLECPHFSRVFVYEAAFSHLVKGVCVLGHLSAVLKHHSRALAAQDLTKDAFLEHPLWAGLYTKINSVVFIVHAYLKALSWS